MRLCLTNIDYKIEDNAPVVYMFVRDIEGNRYIIRDNSFEPYFYIREKDYNVLRLDDKRRGCIKRVEKGNFKLLRASRRGVKIVTYLPGQVRELRNWLHSMRDRREHPRGIETYEADVLFVYRYLIDRKIINGVEIDDKYFRICKDLGYIPWSDEYCGPANVEFSRVRCLFIDIEVTDGIPKEGYTSPVTVIGTYDSFTRQYHVFYWRGSHYSISSDHIIYSRSEDGMFVRFLEYVSKINPDLILSFTKFDMLYLIKRMRKIRLDPSVLSQIGTVKCYDKMERVSIGGVEYIDLGQVYKKVVRGQKWETLDAISNRELGYGKKRLSKGDIYSTWIHDYRSVLLYNLRDVFLIKKLDEKLDLVDYLDVIRRIVGCRFNDAMFAARVADILYLRLLNGKLALFSRPMERAKRGYLGAMVYTAKKGIYDHVVCLDYRSLYPSIIRAYNIGYNTYDPIAGDIVIAENYKYRSDVQSWTVKILNDLSPLLDENKREIEKAKKAKDFAEVKRLKRRRMALKSIVNGIYGFYGYAGNPDEHHPAARLYSSDIAESITVAARKLLEKTWSIVGDLGYEMVYSDTDSVFVKLKGTDNYMDESMELKDKIESRLWSYIRERWRIDPSNFILDLEDVYKKFVILTKKRYSALTIDGDRINKGLEIVRRDQSDLTVETQKGLLDLILKDAPVSRIREFVKGQIRKLDTEPLERVGIAAMLQQRRDSYTSAVIHLKAFEFANQVLKLDLEEGERFYYIFIKPYKLKRVRIRIRLSSPVMSSQGEIYDVVSDEGKGYQNKKIAHITRDIISDVAGFRSSSDLERAPGIVVDKERLLDRTIKSKVEDLLDLVGLSWSEILDETRNQKRSRLDYYFSSS